MEYHTIKPFYNKDSKILILGSFPSIKSREAGFYYAHPQNRFWKVLSNIFNETIENKQEFLKKNHIALFDVCASCEIKGSSDASIKEVVPNDISEILKSSEIKIIFLNGKTAANLYKKYMQDIKIPSVVLPSTSPANATFNLEKLTKEYQVIAKFTK
ncbi:uncharacterized protein BN778_01322 [Mycoplasma sp. CAG:776]|jgi:hypoxanthine-DNA glycosylase|nr:uncharacterized protein BN778_01322 [Mycoplasma sp. CAG:776]